MRSPRSDGAAQDRKLDVDSVDGTASTSSANPASLQVPFDEPTDDELLTDWERDFLASIEFQDFDLTAAQEAKRDEIYALIEERRGAWQPQPQDHHAAWQPVGSVLERLFQSLDYCPTADDDDPRWKRWHVRPGDLVEVRGRCEPIGRWFATHASPLHFKLSDRRVFSQKGWPLLSGERSPIRCRKVQATEAAQ